jgi:hypothetical protein
MATGADASASASVAKADQSDSRPTHSLMPTDEERTSAAHTVITAPERLAVGHCYRTPKACLIFQNDGNLVVYDENGVARWDSGTWGFVDSYADFQTDGHLVIYARNGAPLWGSVTHGNPGATLWVQSDGNVVIYNRSGLPVWATNTDH